MHETDFLLFLNGMMPKLTRTQFNVGTERVIRDWRTTEIIFSVRDQRMHDHDPLVGIVVLPLAEVFKQRPRVGIRHSQDYVRHQAKWLARSL